MSANKVKPNNQIIFLAKDILPDSDNEIQDRGFEYFPELILGEVRRKIKKSGVVFSVLTKYKL